MVPRGPCAAYGALVRAYHADRPTMTLANAARALDISPQTLKKWIDAGFVRVVEMGPADHKIRRIPIAEVERLKPIS